MNVKKMISSLINLVLVSGMAAVLKAQGTANYHWPIFTLEGDLYQAALKHLKEEKFADAAKTYEELVLRKPFALTPRFLLATTYISMGDKDAALEQYKKLKKLDQEKSEELYNLINRKESAV